MSKTQDETAKTVDRTTITISKDAKKLLDEYGRKNENYSDLILRMASDCGCKTTSTDEKVAEENHKNE